MAQLDRIKEARRAVLAAAAERWRRRGDQRQRNKADIGAKGAGGADSQGRVARMAAREVGFAHAAELRRRGELPIGIERKMGPTLDFTAFAPSDAARRAGRPVARIVQMADPGLQPEGFATGFLVTPGLLLTNHHVFPNAGDAVGTGANFLFERNERGVAQGVTFALDPGRFFLSDERLDYAVVAVQPHAAGGQTLAELGFIALIEATPKILIGEPVHIIQYPEGGPKAYAVTNDRLVDILDEGFLHYDTDTLEGSSGSPAFSKNWELVALHHASIPEMRDGKVIARNGSVWTEDMGDDAVHWIANEGIRVSAIVKHLGTRTLPGMPAQAMLAALLAGTTDPVDDLASALATPPAAPVAAAPSPSPPPPPSAPERQQLRAAMSGLQVTVTGPVTININTVTVGTGAAPAIAPPVTAAAPPPPTVAVEKTLRFDPDYDDREGYDPGFLGVAVPMPEVTGERANEVLRNDSGEPLVLAYHHFSLTMNEPRRLMMWSAVNVDYDPDKKSDGGRGFFGTDRWVADPRIPASKQLTDPEFYKPAHKIDRGHIVRREDNAWGNTPAEIEFANSDTFHWTNCTPQHEAFNRDAPGAGYGGLHGLWGDFEQYIQHSLQDVDHRACILAGPVLAADDPSDDFGGGPIQYPLLFWKVVAVTVTAADTAPELRVFGFLLSQKPVVDRFGIERFGPGRFARYQATLAHITELTGVGFDPVLHAADTLRDTAETSVAINGPAEIRGLRRAGQPGP